MNGDDIVLDVKDLKVYFHSDAGDARAVDGASFTIRRGKTLAIVGESGCGKSVTSYSILRLTQKPGRIAGGSILFRPSKGEPVDIASLDEKSEVLFKIRGGLISMIFQEPMTALSPVHTVGDQIAEAVMLHQNATKEDAMRRAVEMLSKVGIPGPEKRIKLYPHEMSGGMRQRVVIAMALACTPELIIADEPTTALDVTIQAQILSLIKEIQKDVGVSVLLITHDLGVVAQEADDVAVMYLGRIVEYSSVRSVLKDARHPYTMGLLKSLPSLAKQGERLPSIAGTVPSLTEIPPGCPFHPRCPYMKAGVCDIGGAPALDAVADGHTAACVRAGEIYNER
ncbi:MAG: ABC transporter ATP-binding protein [Spirochaetes bacterium]|nr:ABC transporter ATP-binding protein [Spirochaetota bacterium]